jgi:hygromycin-B 4-O-kinase
MTCALGFYLEIFMYKEQLKLDNPHVENFLANHYNEPVTALTPLSGGAWSQAYGFKQAGQDLVIRISKYQDDYLKDQIASRFGSVKLPIPKVLEVGEFKNAYYAISERAFGTMIDDLDKDGMKRIIPSLMATLDAMRETDISNTTGYGEWDLNGNGKYQSWRDMLLAVKNDDRYAKIRGWRTKLKSTIIGDGPFNEAYIRLVELSADLPEVRSLIHNDLMHFNVLTNNDRITAVFDWANATYGDFLYDLAMLVFWGPLHEPIKGINWEAEALAHYDKIGLEVPEFKRRLQCCMLHVGLDSMAYHGFLKNSPWLEPVAKRTLEIANTAY